jgi:peptidoglycan/LPS O-acetylase OafA/YrhL
MKNNYPTMKPSKKEESDRVAFFDILRIVFVAAIVYGHYQILKIDWLNRTFFSSSYMPLNLYPLSLGILAVYGMFFVSGAVIQLKYKKIQTLSEYKKFLFKRFTRLYPAFWMSLVLGLLLFPGLLGLGIINLSIEFTGFYAFLGTGSGVINQMGWFIGAIFSLYILFPVLSGFLKKYQLKGLLVLLVISFTTRTLLFAYNPLQMFDIFLWFPACNFFEFGLGIYVVQNRLYPHRIRAPSFIRQLSELSFYVFLFHVIIINVFKGLVFQERYYYLVVFLFYATIIVVSFIAMFMDRKVQQVIMQNSRIKIFLNS